MKSSVWRSRQHGEHQATVRRLIERRKALSWLTGRPQPAQVYCM
jgi:hypothetical protein